jgi:hypothetical protein
VCIIVVSDVISVLEHVERSYVELSGVIDGGTDNSGRANVEHLVDYRAVQWSGFVLEGRAADSGKQVCVVSYREWAGCVAPRSHDGCRCRLKCQQHRWRGFGTSDATVASRKWRVEVQG